MPRIIIAECKQEVSTFNPVPSCYEDFRIIRGQDIINTRRGTAQEIGGALEVFDTDPSIVLAPALSARANTSGGVLSADSHDRLSSEFLDALARTGDADGAYFALHGAMQSASESDPEGYLLQEARRILGDDLPIVISVDLHGILTDRMLQHVDAVVPYHTYPHVDFSETGGRAAALLMKILSGSVRPVTARVKIPALVRGDELITEMGAVGECIRMAKQIEAGEGGLSAGGRGLAAGIMWGNPFTDVPELRTNSIVTTDDDETAARQHAVELANLFWNHHEKMQVPLTSLEEAARAAARVDAGTVVMMDAADATSSGASGDSNAIAAELVRKGYRGSVLAPVVDPPAVRKAFEAGVGATISTTVGGALDPARFEPLEIDARVRLLSDGLFRSESFGWPWDSGDTAVLQSDNITFIVGTRPVSLFDRSWFYAHGQDPARFDVVVVKSPHCEHHMFAKWCAELINVDAPGSTSANLHSLGHTTCARPIFPLDDIRDFTPQADIFRRT